MFDERKNLDVSSNDPVSGHEAGQPTEMLQLVHPLISARGRTECCNISVALPGGGGDDEDIVGNRRSCFSVQLHLITPRLLGTPIWPGIHLDVGVHEKPLTRLAPQHCT